MLGLGLAGFSPPTALAAPATEWPQFLGGPAHQGVDQPSIITPANVATLETAWHADIGASDSSPTVVGGVVYVGAIGGLTPSLRSARESRVASPSGMRGSP